MKPIGIECQLAKVAMTADGGWRITFDTGESSGDAVAKLATLKRLALYVVVMTQEQADAVEAGESH